MLYLLINHLCYHTTRMGLGVNQLMHGIFTKQGHLKDLLNERGDIASTSRGIFSTTDVVGKCAV